MFLFSFVRTEHYETTDIADYGNYIGNNDNNFPSEFIGSFFPEKIGENFTDIVYSYRAENADTYGFEAYLEFTINDLEALQHHISKIAPLEEWQEFRFDSSYYEYVISDVLAIDLWEPGGEHRGLPVYSISQCKIGRILFAPDENRVIYVAMGVFDGGGADTAYLCSFFDRFDIDPMEYAEYAESPYADS